MDISKLESLACLRLNPAIKDEVSKSLDEVVKSLQGVTEIKVENQSQDNISETVFRKEQFTKPETYGLNITEDEYFLAPKVIRKE